MASYVSGQMFSITFEDERNEIFIADSVQRIGNYNEEVEYDIKQE